MRAVARARSRARAPSAAPRRARGAGRSSGLERRRLAGCRRRRAARGPAAPPAGAPSEARRDASPVGQPARARGRPRARRCRRPSPTPGPGRRTTTRSPRAAHRARNSCTRRVLPIPASPMTCAAASIASASWRRDSSQSMRVVARRGAAARLPAEPRAERRALMRRARCGLRRRRRGARGSLGLLGAARWPSDGRAALAAELLADGVERCRTRGSGCAVERRGRRATRARRRSSERVARARRRTSRARLEAVLARLGQRAQRQRPRTAPGWRARARRCADRAAARQVQQQRLGRGVARRTGTRPASSSKRTTPTE